ncbi:MAG TPA: DUF2231 domain-containing protein [Actinomycetes bacterium]|nr:DUF2231 domain-containing protein [Actinomycetes bacterium]
MAIFSFRPSLTYRGRKFKGLRGWAGKPLHPPLTDVPVGAYTLAGIFDLVSYLGADRAWARDFYRAASFSLITGGIFSVLAALTGFWDWLRSTPRGTQAGRTVNAHFLTMGTVTVLVLAGILVRILGYWDRASTPLPALLLSLAALALTTLGGTIGGTLVYDYGFNIETAGDSPVWHRSERDLLPSDKPDQPPATTGEAPAAATDPSAT